MVSNSILLRNLLVETKDGEWGKAEPYDGSVEMAVIRGTDFDTAKKSSLEGVPVRHIAGKAAGRKTLQPFDILIETAGGSKGKPTGKTTFLRPALFERSRLPITCASFARFLRIDATRADPEFVYWYLQSLYLNGVIENYQVQHTGIARFQFTKFADSIEIDLPPVDVQMQVSAFLGAIENRITLLRETNATLEAIAQALFKSWFVDFDPVRAKAEGLEPEGMDANTAALFPDSFEESESGLVPRGWEHCRVENLAEKVGMGPFGSNIKVDTFVSEGIPVISGQHLRQLLVEDSTFNFITDTHAKKLSNSCVHEGDVIFTHAGSIGQVALLHRHARFDRYILSQRQFFLRCNRLKMQPEWITYYFRSAHGQHQLLANTSQVGVPSIARPVSYLRSIEVLVPSKELIDKFSELADALHQTVLAKRLQIQNLIRLRDTVLPRLISGELRLPETEASVENILSEAV